MSDPAVVQDQSAYQKLAKESKEIAPIVERYRAYKEALGELTKVQEMARAESDPEHAGAGPRGDARAREEARHPGRRDPAAAHPQGPERREERAPRDPRRAPGGDEAALFAGEMFRMYSRFAERQGWKIDVISVEPHRPGRREGSHRPGRGRPRLLEAALRERRPPRAARAGHRGSGPHPHLRGHRGGAARGRGSRREDRGQGPARRHVLLVGPGRPERQHHLLGGAHHPPAHEHRGQLPGREEPDQEPREGDEGAAGAPLRGGPAQEQQKAIASDRKSQVGSGRPQREDPHLQLPAGPGHRSPHRPHHSPPAGDPGRRPGGDRERLDRHHQAEKLKEPEPVR